MVSRDIVEENLYSNPVIRKFLKSFVLQKEKSDLEQRLRSSRNWMVTGNKSFVKNITQKSFSYEKIIQVISN